MVVYRKCYQITMILCTTHNDEILFTIWIRVSAYIFVLLFTVYVSGFNEFYFICHLQFFIKYLSVLWICQTSENKLIFSSPELEDDASGSLWESCIYMYMLCIVTFHCAELGLSFNCSGKTTEVFP